MKYRAENDWETVRFYEPCEKVSQTPSLWPASLRSRLRSEAGGDRDNRPSTGIIRDAYEEDMNSAFRASGSKSVVKKNQKILNDP